MCGIFGVIGKYDGEISQSLSTLSHRGPDDSGEYKDTHVQLGFNRLSIIDLSEVANQPMKNEDGSIWIVFNGEIYNFVDVQRKLEGKHKFESHSDTEVLIHGYEQWGIEGLLEKINGMFAFCLYDKKKQICFLARDRIGKKPLYYFKGPSYLAFASEVKAFFKLKGFKFSVDEDALNLFMGFSYLPDNERTIIKNVFKVPPASFLKIDVKRLSTEQKCFWSLGEETGHTENAEKELENLLVDSVKKRLVADVPVGILLSGGLDSSLITAIASKNKKEKIRTINISFKNSPINESAFAQKVADFCKTDHTALQIDVQDAYKEFKDNIWLYDDLSTVDGGLFSTYLMSKKVRELGIEVILTGEGADEVFGGYTWFGLGKYPFKIFPDKIKGAFYYYAIMRNFSPKYIRALDGLVKGRPEHSYMSYLKKIQRYEIKYSLPNHYCMKLDKGSMGASVEARAPFLDYRVVEYASALPEESLVHGNFFDLKISNEKWILRQIAKKYLPLEIAFRKKKGGMFPTENILNEGLKNDGELVFSNKYLTDFYGPNYLRNLSHLDTTITPRRWYREWVLWKALVFSLWLEHFDGG